MFMIAIIATVLLSVHQTGSAAVIQCPETTEVCNGTPGDDEILGPYTVQSYIHGLGGNDYIIGYGSATGGNFIFGDDGNDILIGAPGNDGLYGGRGNDYYDGNSGHDSIVDNYYQEGPLVKNDDIISGEEGDDYIQSGEGADKIHGGPGNDLIFPDGAYRDFSSDSVNCGSDSDTVYFNSADDVVASNWEDIYDYDR